MDQKVEKWVRWYRHIEVDIRGLLIANRMHHELVEIVRSNPELPETSDLYGHLGATYTSHMVIGLRRQIKTRDSMSLAALLNDLASFPQEMSKKYFVSLYKGSSAETMADTDFLQFASKGVAYIDEARVRLDLERLRNTVRSCEEFADRRVAHLDPRAPRYIPCYVDLDAAIRLLDELCVKYKLLLLGAAPSSLLPTRQYDWTHVLQVPWVNRASTLLG